MKKIKPLPVKKISAKSGSKAVTTGVTPSEDWPIRTADLTGDEYLLKQNPVGDPSPQEELVPTSLILQYIQDNFVVEGVSITGGTVSGTDLLLHRASASDIVIDVTALLDNVEVVSGLVSGNNLTLTMSDASTVVIDVSTLVGGGTTNLSYTASPTQGLVVSDTGTDAILPLATGTNAGLQSPAQFTKLGHITVTQAVDLDTMESNIALKANDADVVHKAGAESITGAKTFSVQPIGIVATSIGNTPAGNIAATTVQTALNELDTDKQQDITFQEEGVTIGTAGGFHTVNFIGGNITAADAGSGVLSVTVSSSAATPDTVVVSNSATIRYSILTGTPVVTSDESTPTAPIITVAGGTIKLKEVIYLWETTIPLNPTITFNGMVSANRQISTPIMMRVINNTSTPTIGATINQQAYIGSNPTTEFGDYTATSMKARLAGGATGGWMIRFFWSMNQ